MNKRDIEIKNIYPSKLYIRRYGFQINEDRYKEWYAKYVQTSAIKTPYSDLALLCCLDIVEIK